MERRIKISTKASDFVEAVLTDENPRTAKLIWEALPIERRANRWADEIYFSTPVSLKEENARAEVEIGAVAYWPPGSAFCIFLGKTPASTHDEPQASSINVFAKVTTDTSVLRKVRDGDKLTLEKSLA